MTVGTPVSAGNNGGTQYLQALCEMESMSETQGDTLCSSLTFSVHSASWRSAVCDTNRHSLWARVVTSCDEK